MKKAWILITLPLLIRCSADRTVIQQPSADIMVYDKEGERLEYALQEQANEKPLSLILRFSQGNEEEGQATYHPIARYGLFTNIDGEFYRFYFDAYQDGIIGNHPDDFYWALNPENGDKAYLSVDSVSVQVSDEGYDRSFSSMGAGEGTRYHLEEARTALHQRTTLYEDHIAFLTAYFKGAVKNAASVIRYGSYQSAQRTTNYDLSIEFSLEQISATGGQIATMQGTMILDPQPEGEVLDAQAIRSVRLAITGAGGIAYNVTWQEDKVELDGIFGMSIIENQSQMAGTVTKRFETSFRFGAGPVSNAVYNAADELLAALRDTYHGLLLAERKENDLREEQRLKEINEQVATFRSMIEQF